MKADVKMSAEALEQQGHDANERGDFATARESFLSAYKLEGRPQHLLSAANMCHT